MFKFVIVLVVAVLLCDASVIKDACTSPGGVKEGMCVNLQDCPSVYALSTDFNTPMSLEKLNYLIGSYCGYYDNNVKVCCALDEIMSSKPEQATIAIETTTFSENSEESSTQTREETTESSNEII